MGSSCPSWFQADWLPGPWEIFAGSSEVTFRDSETQAWSMVWWTWDSRLIGGKSVIKGEEMNNNLTSNGQFSIN